jgi:hypothetical protein
MMANCSRVGGGANGAVKLPCTHFGLDEQSVNSDATNATDHRAATSDPPFQTAPLRRSGSRL